MHPQLGPCLLVVLLSAANAFAEFEGVVAMKMSLVSKEGTPCGGGTIELAIAKAGMRGELQFNLEPGVNTKRVVLCRTDTPNSNYLINDANRTYTEVALDAPTAAKRLGPAKAQWEVEKLGQEKILGYKTQHVMAHRTPGTGQSLELWVATDLLDFETYRKLQACSGGETDEDLAPALKAAGAEGLPLKVVIITPKGARMKLEAVKVKKKSLPAGTFEIPAGYTKWAEGLTVVTGPEAEARKGRMEDGGKKTQRQLEQLSPKQRSLLEKLRQDR